MILEDKETKIIYFGLEIFTRPFFLENVDDKKIIQKPNLKDKVLDFLFLAPVLLEAKFNLIHLYENSKNENYIKSIKTINDMKKLLLIILTLGISFSMLAQSVTTGSTSGLSYNTVTLSGSYTALGYYNTNLQQGQFEVATDVDFTQNVQLIAASPSSTNSSVPLSASGTFSGTLSPNTLYYYRFRAKAYKDNFITLDTVLGGTKTFTTLSDAPIVTTIVVLGIGTTNVSFVASLDDPGADDVIIYGACYGTSTGVDINDDTLGVGRGNDLGVFFPNVTGLSAGTKYYINSFATNSFGTSYGAEKEIITNTIDPTSTAATNILETSFTANWTGVTGAQGYYLDVATDAAFTSFVTGYENLDVGLVTTYDVNTNLSNGTDYYYRVRAYHDGGADGADFTSGSSGTQTLKTRDNPTMSTGDVTAINSISAAVNAEVLDIGGSAITARGVCWGTSPGVDINDNTDVDGSPGIGTYTGSFSSLSAGTKYYYNAYATNSTGTGYGTEKDLITDTDDPVADNATNIDVTSFTANWQSVTGAQGYYIDVATDAAFTSMVSGYDAYNVGDATSFNVTNNLTAGTDYYYRVYAYHDGGTGGADFISNESNTKGATTLSTQPTTQAHSLEWATVGDPANGQMEFTWTNGNGDGRIFIMRANAAVTDPTDGVEYATASTTFASGTNLGNNTYLIYKGTGAKGSVIVSGMDPADEYYFKVLEYNGSGSNINYNTTETNGFGIGNIGDGDLPVNLISFTAKETNNKVQLDWATATEYNNDFFVLERSQNGADFESIAEVKGAGNSNIIQTYCFTDANYPSGVIYYRLKQYDFDGTETVFKTITIDMKNKGNVIQNMYVENSNLNIRFKNSLDQLNVYIIDINGRILSKQNISDRNSNEVKIDMNGYQHGVYFIRVETNNQQINRRFVY